MIEDQLLNYGMAGIFILYLIYDKQILMKKVSTSIDNLTKAINNKKGL